MPFSVSSGLSLAFAGNMAQEAFNTQHHVEDGKLAMQIRQLVGINPRRW